MNHTLIDETEWRKHMETQRETDASQFHKVQERAIRIVTDNLRQAITNTTEAMENCLASSHWLIAQEEITSARALLREAFKRYDAANTMILTAKTVKRRRKR